MVQITTKPVSTTRLLTGPALSKDEIRESREHSLHGSVNTVVSSTVESEPPGASDIDTDAESTVSSVVEEEIESTPNTESESATTDRIEDALVDLGIDSEWIVESYEKGISAINNVREAKEQLPLNADEEATALRVYNASIADGESSAHALSMATVLLDPDNGELLARVIEKHELIESGKVSLLSVLDPEYPGNERTEAEVAIAKADNERLNSGRPQMTAQGKNELRMLHTPVENARIAIEQYNEYGSHEEELTAEQEKDFTLVFNLVVDEGGTEIKAAELARYLLNPENESTLESLKNDMAGVSAKLAGGMSLLQVVNEKEIALVGNMDVLGTYLAGQISEGQAAGNTEGVLMLTVFQEIVDSAKMHASDDNPVLGDGAAMKAYSKATGLTYKQIVQKVREEGDLVAFAALTDDFGKAFVANANEVEIRQAAITMRSVGEVTYAIGNDKGDKRAMAAGRLIVGGAEFYTGLAGEENNGATAISGGGVALAGSVASSVGILTDNSTLIATGSEVSQFASIVGENAITTLIKERDFSTTTTVNIGGVPIDLNIAGVFGGSEEEVETLAQFGSLTSTGYSLLKAFKTNMVGTQLGINAGAGAVGTISALALVQIAEILDLDLPPNFVDLLASFGAGLLNQAGAVVAAEAVTQLIAQAAAINIELSKEAATYLLGEAGVPGIETALGEVLGYAAIVYKVVMLGLDIAEIAQSDADEGDKISASLDAVSMTLLTIGLTQFWNPVGWGLMIAAAVVNVGAAGVDIAENGADIHNVGQLLGGHLSGVMAWIFGMEKPDVNMRFSTRSPQDVSTKPGVIAALNAGLPEDGMVLHASDGGDKDAFLRIETPFGITSFSIHELESKTLNERYDVIRDFKSTLLQMRAVDEALAGGLNAADELNGQSGLSMSSYGSGLVGNQINQNTDAEDMDFAQMMSERYRNIADHMAASGTEAGYALNAWMDGVEKKTINESGEAYVFASALAKNPVLLTLPPHIIERILNTVEPGSQTHVVNQLARTIETYLGARDNQLVQAAMPMDENQAMDFTIAHLGLTEDYRFSAAPRVDTPEKGEVLTAMAGIPQEVQDLAVQLNEGGMRDMPGGVALLGRADWNDEFYQLVVNGELDTYRYRGGDEPHFEKVSRVIADLSGDYNDWPPGDAQGLGVDWAQLEADGARNGDLQWVRDMNDPRVLQDMSAEETDLLERATLLGHDMQALGKDVKVLGLKANPANDYDRQLVEVLIEGKQHAYLLKGDQFIQVSQRNLYSAEQAQLAA